MNEKTTKEVDAILDERIMADGRPAYAWWSEIQMLRHERKEFRDAKDNCTHLMHILGVIEIEQKKEHHTGDYLIRVRRGDLLTAYTEEDAIRKAEITKISS